MITIWSNLVIRHLQILVVGLLSTNFVHCGALYNTIAAKLLKRVIRVYISCFAYNNILISWWLFVLCNRALLDDIVQRRSYWVSLLALYATLLVYPY